MQEFVTAVQFVHAVSEPGLATTGCECLARAVPVFCVLTGTSSTWRCLGTALGSSWPDSLGGCFLWTPVSEMLPFHQAGTVFQINTLMVCEPLPAAEQGSDGDVLRRRQGQLPAQSCLVPALLEDWAESRGSMENAGAALDSLPGNDGSKADRHGACTTL